MTNKRESVTFKGGMSVSWALGECKTGPLLDALWRPSPINESQHAHDMLKRFVERARVAGLGFTIPSVKQLNSLGLYKLTYDMISGQTIRSTELYESILTFCIVGLLMDDLLERDVGRAETLLHAWIHTDTQDPYVAFLDAYVLGVWRRLGVHEAYICAFYDAHTAYLEKGLIPLSRAPFADTSLSEYMEMRRHDIVVGPCFILAQIAMSSTLPPDLWPRIQLNEALVTKCIDHVICQNDVLGVDRDLVGRQEPRLSMTTITQRDHPEWTLEQCIHHLIEQHAVPNLNAIHQLLDATPFAKNMYISVMDGLTSWTARSSRYYTSTSPFERFYRAPPPAKDISSPTDKDTFPFSFSSLFFEPVPATEQTRESESLCPLM